MYYKYFALFFLAVIEGPIVTTIAGFFSSLGFMNFFIAYIIIIIGDLIGDVVHYSLGRFGGRKFIDKWGHYIGIYGKQVELLTKQFEKRGDKLLFIGKMLHGIGGAFLVAAGIVKMRFSKFIFANMFATFIKSLILLLIGFYFGYAFEILNFYFERMFLISFGLVFLMIIIYFLYFRKKSDSQLLE